VTAARSRASAVVAGAVARLPAASLAEVIEGAELQVRIDRKYLIPVDRFAELAARLPGSWAALEIDRRRGFAYESVYFDTPDLLTYRHHLQRRRRRFKVRTRAYLDSGSCAFEVKLKGRRTPARPCGDHRLPADDPGRPRARHPAHLRRRPRLQRQRVDGQGSVPPRARGGQESRAAERRR
jgi:hypothetical protein